ncbi:MAG: tetratricopeptide repeat protein [Anaerolineaceae bacterium]|nr:tetratricopeptide repeat protein [Anaerolineaceae bacterium]
MATISLKAYISRVDTLLTVGNLDEVAQHCRHILVSYPKNLEASHMLGQALVQMGGNSSEAQALLRRVLATTPDDAATHAAIGEIHENSAQYVEAIWHLERASEHATENRSYRERLRNLYRLQRGEGAELPEGLPGAVARRQIREGQRVQAIRTLKNALKGEPGRQDLRLLLARAQWDAEKRLDAAESALDVLEALPWCLHANRIVASLWLAELRPSDARPFLERIHDVDPYLSLRLASNNPPDEHTWTLTELDYRQVDQNQPTERQSPPTPRPAGKGGSWQRREDGYPPDVTDGSLPDWLQQGIATDTASDELAWLEGDAPAATAAAATEARNSVLPWESSEMSALSAPSPGETTHGAGDELDWLGSPPGDGAQWFPEDSPDVSASSSHISHELLSAGQPSPSPSSGADWYNPLRAMTPDPASANPRQQQYVFSRLPLWLRVPGRSLPSLRPSRNPDQNLG